MGRTEDEFSACSRFPFSLLRSNSIRVSFGRLKYRIGQGDDECSEFGATSLSQDWTSIRNILQRCIKLVTNLGKPLLSVSMAAPSRVKDRAGESNTPRNLFRFSVVRDKSRNLPKSRSTRLVGVQPPGARNPPRPCFCRKHLAFRTSSVEHGVNRMEARTERPCVKRSLTPQRSWISEQT